MQGFFDELVARDFSEENLKSNDDANVCYRDCVELSILALSKQPAVTERLLISLCEAYDDCHREDCGILFDKLLDDVDAVIARHCNQNVGNQNLSDDDKAAINKTVANLIREIRDAIINAAAVAYGEPVEADILTGTENFKE